MNESDVGLLLGSLKDIADSLEKIAEALKIRQEEEKTDCFYAPEPQGWV